MKTQGVATLEEEGRAKGGDQNGDSDFQKLSERVRYRLGEYIVVCESPDAATAADLAAGFEQQPHQVLQPRTVQRNGAA